MCTTAMPSAMRMFISITIIIKYMHMHVAAVHAALIYMHVQTHADTMCVVECLREH